jgi:hypothetical protein
LKLDISTRELDAPLFNTGVAGDMFEHKHNTHSTQMNDSDFKMGFEEERERLFTTATVPLCVGFARM